MIALRDQVYSSPPGGDLTYDFFRPADDRVLPLVLFIHGGGWISGDKEMYREEALWLAPQGFACACISYRLAPLFPFPAAIVDVQRFLTHAREQADHLQIDPQRLIAVGNSAGGHLACMAGLCDEDFETGAPVPKANGVVDICGIADLRNPDTNHFAIANSFLEQFMGGPHFGNEEAWAKASPIVHVSPNDAPFLIIHGTEDDVVPVQQSRDLAAALQGVGVRAEYIELDGEMHAFSLGAWGRIRSEILRFATQFV